MARLAALGFLAALNGAGALQLSSRQAAGNTTFDWTSLTATDDLKSLTTCYGIFKCGLLNVPLDYTSSDSPKATIAVQVLPATDTTNYKGALLFNPGGPGVSGTSTVLSSGTFLAKLVGPAYDIVGFDPRAAGHTTPHAQCFDSAEDWAAFEQTEINVLETKKDLALALARDEVIAAKCAAKLGGTGKEVAGGSIEEWGGGRFVDTGSTANDMLRIVQAFGQQKLNYFGISYGTALGQYFAAMHPDKINLMLIDGVLDAEEWRAGNIQPQIQDSDKVMGTFFDLCAEAGRSVCPVAEKTAARTETRVKAILAALKERPIAVVPQVNGQLVVTYDMVMADLRVDLYTPSSGFAKLAQTLAAVEARNATALYDFGELDPTTLLPEWLYGDQSRQAISCTDFPNLSKITLSNELSMLRSAINTSYWFGPTLSRIKVDCIPWKIRAKHPYTGVLTSSKVAGKILITNNVLDPVTPLVNAKAVQKRFSNSALLIQNSIGHTVLESLGSCAGKVIGAFFQAGILPKSGTICEPDSLPFIGATNGTGITNHE